MKASDLFVKALENENVDYIFGVPGEENLDFLESIRKSSIKLILNRHEQAAAFMAANYGRLTGKPGVVLSTLGPGATNLVTGSAYAQLGAMPLVMITGQKPIKKSKQGRFQILDVVDMMQPITKYTKQIVDASRISSSVREAFRLAREERPGAVHLELPEDIAQEETEEILFEPNYPRRPEADDEAISKAAEMINKSENPLLLIGAAANRNSICKALTEFVDTTGIWFFNTQMGKGVVDERNQRYLGTAALSDNDFLHCALDEADLVINVGHDVIEKPPFFMEQGGKNVIHINNFTAEVDDVYFPQHEVIGDIATSIKKLKKQCKTEMWECNYFKESKINIESHLSKYFKDDRFPILPQRLVKIMRDSLSDKDIVSLDNGIYKIWFARNYKAYEPNTLLLDNALASMGAGVPAAMSAKLVHPNRKVVAVCGDGGFMMNSQEIETAVREKLDIVVVVLNDNSYGMIKWKQEGMGFKDFGLNYNNPDFVKYAESYGAIGYRPESTKEFERDLNTALNDNGVSIIDLSVDYSLNHKILNELLNEDICK